MDSLKEEIREHISAIYQTALDEIKNVFNLLKEIWPLLFLLLLALSVLIWFAKPAPPKKVLMATGVGGSYKVLGEKYRTFFEKKGIELKLIETHGSKENLQHLIDRNDPIQAAFVQGGMIASDDLSGVQSLGSVDYEPVWVFYHSKAFNESTRLSDRDIARLKINIGPIGSGTHTQAVNIFKLNHLNTSSPNLLNMGNTDGVSALERGEIDGVILVDGFDSPNVQRLIKNPDIRLATFKRADAYTRLLSYFEEVSVPMGGFDLGSNTPDHPIQLISTTTNLLIDDRLHPAIQVLFLEAAREINGGKSYFSKVGEFPVYMNTEAPLSNEAKYFYEKGTPTLMKYLPFWLAEFIERMFVLLLPFAAFAYPIVKSIPNYRMNLARKQINSIYKDLDKFEQNTIESFDPSKRAEYIEILNEMELRALNSKASRLATAECYSLRSNIEFIRNALEKQVIYKGRQAH
ncbi:TAXI family TRAP transporter solute-binding subunit [Polynucleobacter sp. MWH-Braz-FAM2G]|uniref:TAXI family TRAP transporter solute-binding subunit n=1 Tax=Polynucleobacter sp. MWH-Braz-FAM2G TaxID=1855883 RepID=UPI001BFE644A|nr:TAXI family TRAP transporter solute-binding subunit [Polynucleobacter sp. MWH-Braz-FAM2G]QWD91322.1 TRAP transporter substrate-binding protein [Polynucleobacter sp. MWH-Braz-FAM2G]